MDTAAKNITFSENGICNFCSDFSDLIEKKTFQEFKLERDNLLKRVIRDGHDNEYDCVIGLSGGVDSSYALYQAVKNGLRPLAVHLDNGWNSELAVYNIHNLVTKLDVDLITHVVDWEEYRDLQISFFKAGVVDIELISDNALIALNYRIASKHSIKWILSGSNRSTEGMAMPLGWNWLKFDARNIKDIHRKFGSIQKISHPTISVMGLLINRYVLGIKWIPFLDYFDYNKDLAVKVLQDECGYRPYAFKHYESIFTRFYQGYILPKKFGIDKRKLHLSTLIITGQMTRNEALDILSEEPHNHSSLTGDYEFVLKRLKMSEDDFEKYISASEAPHDLFLTDKKLWDFLNKIHKIFFRISIFISLKKLVK